MTVVPKVVNGTEEPGLATHQAGVLTGLGFQADVDRTGTSTTLTTVTYPRGEEAQAKAVAAVVPGAAVAASSSVTEVTLTLGTDGRTVAFVWDHVFHGDRMFERFRERVSRDVLGLDLVPHEEFGNIHGTSAEEHEAVDLLPQRLAANRVDAAIVGVGA